jgi:iron transport multicopper oxidase
MIVHDPKDPFSDKYDEEFVVTLSDWYHENSIDLVRSMLVPNNTRFAPPLGLAGPDGMLVNDGGSVDYKVEVGKTYRFRFMNIGAFTSFFLHFDGHPMTVIMQDASYTVAGEADQLRIAPAQRFDVLITITEQDGSKNFPFLMAMDFSPNYRLSEPAPWSKLNKFNKTGYLILDASAPKPPAETIYQLQPFNDNLFQPLDGTPAWGPVSKHVTLDFTPQFDANGIPRMPFNGKPYVRQEVPTLYTASSVGEANTNPVVYGQVNPFIVSMGDIVEIVINNNHSAIHPFHLHGHQFQVLDRPLPQAGFYAGNSTVSGTPPSRKDTVHVEPFSYAVLRVNVTEPGVFLIHCHIEWHVEMGLVATIIQAPELLRNLPIPQDHLQACMDSGIPYTGNAAGNQDPLNTTGFQTVASIPYNGALWFPPQNANSTNNGSSNGTKIVLSSSSSRLAPRFPQSFMALFSGVFGAFVWMAL